MIVVSDTSPLRYLAEIGGLEWLPAIFGEVICPSGVIAECLHPCAPLPLREWAASEPAWLRVEEVPKEALLKLPQNLDSGEVAALSLARELHADLLLIDERRGRDAATRLGFEITRTLGIMVEASLLGIADFEAVLDRLVSSTNFRASDAVISLARARLAEGDVKR